jgi:hypothetical protein
MAETKRVELECVTCKNWSTFPIQFVESDSLDTSMEIDRILRCPACGALAPFRRERMRLADNHGKVDRHPRVNAGGQVLWLHGWVAAMAQRFLGAQRSPRPLAAVPKSLDPGTYLATRPVHTDRERRSMSSQGGPKNGSDEVVQAILMAAIALSLLALLWLLP